MDLVHIAIGVIINILDRLVIISEGFECWEILKDLNDLFHCCNVHGIQWSELTVTLLNAQPY